MTTCHSGTGHTGEDRDFNSHVDDTGIIDIGPIMKTKAQTVQILHLLLEDQR